MGRGDPRRGRTTDVEEPPRLPEGVRPALAVVDRVFGSFSSPDETGCPHCYGEEEIDLLRRPGVPIPDTLLHALTIEEPGHFGDYLAVVRRLMPQMLRAMVRKGLPDTDETCFPLARPEIDWQSWPAEEATAIVAVVDAWWASSLSEPTGDPAKAFDVVAAIGLDVTTYLARWESGPVPDQHLADLARCLVHPMSQAGEHDYPDENPRTREVTSVLYAWLADTGATRLRSLGEHELAEQCELLVRPLAERMRLLFGTVTEP
ncbi:hypothetical protein [Antribacter gilvus]|uniref:hypothetical protein n=1 Tax=Antribacter gilvus TaxID=2304675 RepID=UPI0019803E14|nr:hypothetical protein [Antribacter gilvus]